MMKKLDIIGKRFTKLTVVSTAGIDKSGHLVYLCSCDCGEKRTLTTSALTSGNTKSCGCLSRGMDRSGINNHNYGHGENMRGDKHPNYRHGLSRTREYDSHSQSIRRNRKRSQVSDDVDFDKIISMYKICKKMNTLKSREYVVDHIKPLSKGGQHHQDNLQILPYHLNATKHKKWPLSEDEQKLYSGIKIDQLQSLEERVWCV